MRKFIIALALLLGILFIITRFTEVQTIANTFRRGDWRFLLLAVVVQIAWLVNMASSFRAIYQAMGMEENRGHLLRLAAAANFLSVVAPAGGMSGIAVFIADARRRNYSPARAAVAGALYILFDYAGFLCVLTLGLLVLIRRNNLHWPEIMASIILLSIALALATLLYLATHSARQLGRVLAWIARFVNYALRPLLQREYLSEMRAQTFAHDAADGVRVLRGHPDNLMLPFALALSSKALLISVLFLVFLAFKVPFSVGTLIAGFSMAYLFLIVSPTPSGIGVVEGVLTLSLTTLYVPLDAATVVTMAYRGITFWLPLLFGMFSFRSLGKFDTINQAEIN